MTEGKRVKFDQVKVTANMNAGEKECVHQDKILTNFLWWCKKNDMKISEKVYIANKSRHRYGMFAKHAIQKSEVLFEVPRPLLLWDENCSSTKFQEASLESNSGWAKLILALMLEYTDSDSKWRSYLDFAPSIEVLDLPLHWPADVREKILGGCSLYDAIEQDIKNIETEYNTIALPFIKANLDMGFNVDVHTLDLYKHMAGFVMAYSFTEPILDDDDIAPPPKMVPMADVLNHISQHNAELQFEEDSLKMIAASDIFEGEEVFNTYGQLSNSQLLQMYGFVEFDGCNKNDTVDIEVEYLRKGVEEVWQGRDKNDLEERWSYVFDEDGGALEGCEFVAIGVNGILSYDEAKLILKVLTIDRSSFESLKKDGWESDSDSDSSESDEVAVWSWSKMSEAPPPQKTILKKAASGVRDGLQTTLDEKLKLHFPDAVNRCRKEKVVTLLRGQICILAKLIEAC